MYMYAAGAKQARTGATLKGCGGLNEVGMAIEGSCVVIHEMRICEEQGPHTQGHRPNHPSPLTHHEVEFCIGMTTDWSGGCMGPHAAAPGQPPQGSRRD